VCRVELIRLTWVSEARSPHYAAFSSEDLSNLQDVISGFCVCKDM
jgi:hypothetical protein